MIRVCLVAPAWMTGGQTVEARTLCDGFAEDPDVRVELQPIDPLIPAWLARVRGLRTAVRLPLFYWGLIRRILRSDVVHVFTAAFWPFVLTTTPAVLLARLFGRPVILNYRDGRARDHIRHAPVRWVLQRATRLVFPSGYLRDVFREFGLDGVVVPNVVDTERFKFRERRPLRPVLLSCRLLEELYDVENTILAFEQVRRAHPEARLLVAGEGDRRSSLEALVAERGIDGVEFIGAVPHGDMGAVYDRADILVNSSRIDNMPHCMIEAFAAGLPIVTTPAGGIPYVVEEGKTGIFVPAGEPADMADAVSALLCDEGVVERMVSAGSEECRRNYTWSAVQRTWLALYRGLAEETPAHERALGLRRGA